jgi:hypothetical protein
MEVGFHKNGVLMLKSADGILHVLDPQETLRDAARYVWNEESLKSFRIEGEDVSMRNHAAVKFVKLSPENSDKNERLRSLHHDDDPYFQE